MVIVNLTRKQLGVIEIKTQDSECRIFDNIQEAERWLVDNNFYYGRRDFFQYENAEDMEWCHKKDCSWEYITVDFENIDDMNKASRYKNFNPGMAPWER